MSTLTVINPASDHYRIAPLRKEPHHAHHWLDLIRTFPRPHSYKEAHRAHHWLDLIAPDTRPIHSEIEEARHAHHWLDLIRTCP